MYRPDRVILRKIQEYDSHLFVEWNSRRRYFEIWRHMPHGRRLVTPVTQSLYDPSAPLAFAPLDERVLWWLYQADGWNKANGYKAHHLEQDRRFMEVHRKQEKDYRESWRSIGREMWHSLNNQFVTRHASKNSGKPTFNKVSPYSQWVRPDQKLVTSSRLYQRSTGNAKRYGWKG